MSITQTYFLAHSARGKLSREAARSDHNLRILVGHANLLDSLMLELAEAEREQENWFHQTVRGVTEDSLHQAQEQQQHQQQQQLQRLQQHQHKHIQWAETIVEEPEEDWNVEDAESESDEDFDGHDLAMAMHLSSEAISVTSTPIDDDSDEEYEDDETDDALALHRSHSHVPDLSPDDSDEEDDSMPPSPPQPMLEFTDTQRKQIATSAYYDFHHTKALAASPAANAPPPRLSHAQQAAFAEEGFFLPARAPSPAVVRAY
ncbi:MAG: hypothetical protein M1829_003059 [Trizodia sp. TS-e1964]|nr:MAG: hypothetical protein M1829_003059 [Trizodia sp. TS-e1964]